MKQLLIFHLLVLIGCAQTETTRGPTSITESVRVSVLGDHESFGSLLCSKAHFQSHEQNKCLKWVKANLGQSPFNIALNICNKQSTMEARQANCFEEAGKNIQIDNNFRIQTRACLEKTSYTSKRECYVSLFNRK